LDRLIDIWGADGITAIFHVVKAAMAALNPGCQQAKVFYWCSLPCEAKKRSGMSTRSESFVQRCVNYAMKLVKMLPFLFNVLRGADRMNGILIWNWRNPKSKDNPVYYVQYAHARVMQCVPSIALKDN